MLDYVFDDRLWLASVSRRWALLDGETGQFRLLWSDGAQTLASGGQVTHTRIR